MHVIKRPSELLKRHLEAAGLDPNRKVTVDPSRVAETLARVKQQEHHYPITHEEAEAIAITHEAWRTRPQEPLEEPSVGRPCEDLAKRILLPLWLIVALLALLALLSVHAHAQYANTNILTVQQDSAFYDASNHAIKVNCSVGCVAGGSFTDNAAFVAGTTAIGITGGWYSTSPTNCTSGSACAPQLSIDRKLFVQAFNPTGTNFHIVCDSGCGGAASFGDNAAFTAGTTAINITGGWFSTTPTNCTSGSACAPQLTTDRKLFVQDFQGTSPWVVSGTVTANAGTGTFATSSTQLPAALDGSGFLKVHEQGTAAVSGTVTANIGTTNGLALDASVTGLQVAQGSTTSGQKGDLILGAVTTAAPTYTTAQSDPLSLTAAGALRVDGSGVTQPVSGTVTANAGSGTFTVGGTVTANAGTGNFTVTQATAANLNATVAGTVTANQGGSNWTVNVAQVNGSTTATAATGVQKVGIVGNAGGAVDAATGAAPPANAVLAGGLTSGATGGLVAALPVCDSYDVVNISTAATTLEITGVSGRQVRICALHLIAAAADNVAIIEGTGATCGTGTAGMAGGTTAASGYNFPANGGIALGSGIGTVLRTATAGDSVCIVTSAATQLSGGISYTIY